MKFYYTREIAERVQEIPQRVLLVTPDYPPPDGGIQTLTRNLEIGIEALGNDASLVHESIESYEIALSDLIPRPRWIDSASDLLSRQWMYNNHLYRETNERIQSFSPDVIHAVHVVCRGAIQAGSDNGIPTVVSAHGLELGQKELSRGTIEKADITHCVSEFTATLVEDLVEDTPINVIHPSIEVRKYRNASETYDTIPGKVITIARLVERKNIDTLIRAWKRIEGSIDEGRLVVIGEGPKREELLKQASEVDSIDFTGWVEEEEKLRHLAESEIFVLVPRQFEYDVEGFGIVYIEAQAAGTPVLGSRRGGVPEAVGDGGLLVENETNIQEVATALNELLANAEARRQYQDAGQRRIMEFDTTEIAKKHIRNYPRRSGVAER